jgi:2-dehydropantoate 2-reductase
VTATRIEHVGIVGAGAVGGYYGALLAAAGARVTMLARPAQVDALRAHGLRLATAEGERAWAVEASADTSILGHADVVLVCVKSADTETVGRSLAPVLRPGAIVCSLQNGVDNAARLEATVGRPVWAVPVYVAAENVAPGHVRHWGGGKLVVPADAGADAVAALFERAGVSLRRSGNVQGALWSKLVMNCAYNALSAITNLPYGELVLRSGMPQVMRDAVIECIRVAEASGVVLEGDVFEGVADIARTMPGQWSSTAQDLRRGRRTEIDDLNGAIVRRGVALAIATPVNRTLHTLVVALEGGRGGD